MFQCTASCKYTMLKTSKRCWRVRKVNEVPMIFQFYANPSPIHSFVFSWIAGCGRDVLKYSCYSHIYIYIIILFSCNWQWLALSELSCQLILNLFPQRQHHRQTQQERTADLFWTSWAKQVTCLAVDLEGRMSIHMKVQGMFNCKLSSVTGRIFWYLSISFDG